MFILIKASRWISGDEAIAADAYRGLACKRAGVIEGRIYLNLVDAANDAVKLGKVNPVGFRVWRIGSREPELIP